MRKSQKGFTLIELVVVIVVLAIMALVTLPKYFDISSDAKLSALKGQLGTVRAAISLQYAQNIIENDTEADDYFFPDAIVVGMFQDGTIPEEAFDESATVKVVTDAGAIADMAGTTGFDDAGGWIYNKRTGEFRSNSATAARRAL